MGNTTFTWYSKKQSTKTLSPCEVKYVMEPPCMPHYMTNLKEFNYAQHQSTKIYVDTKSVISLINKLILH